MLSDDSDETHLGATFDRAASAHARTSVANATPRTAAAAKDKAPVQSPEDEQRRKRAAMRRAEFLAQSAHDRTGEQEARGPAPGVQAAGAAPEPAAADVARKSGSPPPVSMNISTSFPGDFVPSGGASARHAPPTSMQTSAWRLRTHALMLGLLKTRLSAHDEHFCFLPLAFGHNTRSPSPQAGRCMRRRSQRQAAM